MPDSQAQLKSQVVEIYRKISSGKLEDAGHACERLVQTEPDFAPGWLAFSRLWIACGALERAGACAAHAVELEPDAVPLNLQLAHCHQLNGDETSALMILDKAIKAGIESPRDLDQLGDVLFACRLFQQAASAYGQSLQLDSGNPNVLFKLARCLMANGDHEQARDILQEILDQQPAAGEVQYARSLLCDSADPIESLESAFERSTSKRDRVLLGYALFEYRDRREQHDQAFQALTEAAASMRQQSAYQVKRDIQALEHIRQTIPSLDQTADDAQQSQAPIFITGLSHSLISALQQSLRAHPDIQAADRFNEFRYLLGQAMPKADGETDPVSANEVFSAIDYAQLGEDYLQRVHFRTDYSEHVVDTNPDNALYAGLIHLALPNSRIILLDEHPLSSCFELYSTLFSGPEYPFSYSLQDLAGYVAAYRQLIAAWQEWIPAANLLVLSADQLKSSPEQALKTLMSFCNLSIESRCVETLERVVSGTEALHAIQQPHHFQTPDRWKAYPEYVRDMSQVLDNHGVSVESSGHE